MNKTFRTCLAISALAALALIVGLLMQNETVWKPAVVITVVGFTIGMGGLPALKTYRYTAWIITAVVVAMIFPSAFTKWGEFDLRNK